MWKTLTIGSNGGVQTRTNKKKQLSQKSTHTRTLTMCACVSVCVVEYYSAVHLVAVELVWLLVVALASEQYADGRSVIALIHAQQTARIISMNKYV